MRLMLLGKIHRVTVTATDLNYEGSLAVDVTLLNGAGILPYEGVQVVNVTNGHRWQTYVIPAPAGSGTVLVNGAAARLSQPGDRIIIMAYGWLPHPEALGHHPRILLVDEHNRPQEVDFAL